MEQMDRFTVEQKVRQCLAKTFPTDRFEWETVDGSEPFTGPVIRFQARQLLYLVYALEDVFKIRFSQEDVIQYRMLTIDGVTAVIMQNNI